MLSGLQQTDVKILSRMTASLNHSAMHCQATCSERGRAVQALMIKARWQPLRGAAFSAKCVRVYSQNGLYDFLLVNTGHFTILKFLILPFDIFCECGENNYLIILMYIFVFSGRAYLWENGRTTCQGNKILNKNL